MSLVEFNSTEALASLEVARIEADTVDQGTTELLGLINKAMEQSRAGVLPLMTVEDDEFISSEVLKVIAARASSNNRVVLAECEALIASAQVIAAMLSGMEKTSQEACAKANDAVRVLLSYHSALSNSGRSIMVTPDKMNGDFSKIGESITSAITGGSNANAKVSYYQTNGTPGNFVELVNGVEKNKPLDTSEFQFIDKAGERARIGNVTDLDEATMFEVESYDIELPVRAAVIDREFMPSSFTKVVKPVRNGDEPVTMVPVYWWKKESDDGLFADVTFDITTGALSLLTIKVADRTDQNGLAIPLPSIERVDISVDEKNWTQVDCPYDAIISAAGGEISVHVNAESAKYVRIRLRQSTAYNTSVINACHWIIPTSGDPYWLTGVDEPVYKMELHNKESWFVPAMYRDVNGNYIERRVFAIDALKYSISLREVRAEVHQYASSTTAESVSYKFKNGLSSVMLRVNEVIPEGTSITYEISHDDGGSWNEIIPLERSGQGAEVILFSSGGTGNPNTSGSASYVSVLKPPTSIRVRAKLESNGKIAPSFKRLSIEPTFTEE